MIIETKKYVTLCSLILITIPASTFPDVQKAENNVSCEYSLCTYNQYCWARGHLMVKGQSTTGPVRQYRTSYVSQLLQADHVSSPFCPVMWTLQSDGWDCKRNVFRCLSLSHSLRTVSVKQTKKCLSYSKSKRQTCFIFFMMSLKPPTITLQH